MNYLKKALLRVSKMIQEKLFIALALKVSNFPIIFNVACDTLIVGIGGVLSQESKFITFFYEKNYMRLDKIIFL